MAERIALVRATTGELLHPEVEVHPGDDTRKLSLPGAVDFSVDAQQWHKVLAHDNSYFFDERKTLVVVTADNDQIRQVGLVDKLTPQGAKLQVACGGIAMTLGQSGPWEGAQRAYVSEDPLSVFRSVWEHATSYSNAVAGVRVTGDTRTGSTVGYPGSARWQNAYKQYSALKPQLDKAQGQLLEAERRMSSRKEIMFKAAGLKRVGDVTVAEARPDDPEYKANSTLWIRESDSLAHVWTGERWHSRPAANTAVLNYLNYQRTLDRAKAAVDEIQYNIEPAQELLDKYENEAREEYSLYYWQNHDLNDVVAQLMALGPFEYREKAAWLPGDKLDLQIEVGAPRLGVRRHELHLEFGRNIQGDVHREYETPYTGLALFGAGSGSEVLSEQRNWNPQHVVRNIAVETDKDAHTRSLVRAAANKHRDALRNASGLKFTELTIYHDDACPENSFDVGDLLFITGKLNDGTIVDRWVRVLAARKPWGTNTTVIEVENA